MCGITGCFIALLQARNVKYNSCVLQQGGDDKKNGEQQRWRQQNEEIIPSAFRILYWLNDHFLPFSMQNDPYAARKVLNFPQNFAFTSFCLGCYNPSTGAALTLEQEICDSRLSELSVSSFFHSYSASQSILFMTWPSEDSLGWVGSFSNPRLFFHTIILFCSSHHITCFLSLRVWSGLS